MSEMVDISEVASPFGYAARLVQTKSTATVSALYQVKCGVDPTPFFSRSGEHVFLYECTVTGYRFWRPEGIAGDEGFYRMLSTAWPNYYRTQRWEHDHARGLLKNRSSVLEIGCGKGDFLRSLEGHVLDATGIELNQDAIADKVTRFPIRRATIEELATDGTLFDAVYAFQVLEHVPDPCSFIHASLKCLSPGGILMFSVPNSEHVRFQRQEDAFDLPPHHIGHFNPDVCRAIARHFGLEVESVQVQTARFHPPEVSTHLSQRATYKLFRMASIAAMNSCYSLLKEPGENLLMVFKKNRSTTS